MQFTSYFLDARTSTAQYWILLSSEALLCVLLRTGAGQSSRGRAAVCRGDGWALNLLCLQSLPAHWKWPELLNFSRSSAALPLSPSFSLFHSGVAWGFIWLAGTGFDGSSCCWGKRWRSERCRLVWAYSASFLWMKLVKKKKKKVKSSSCSCCQSHSIVAECICFFSPPKRINMALNDFPDAWISCLMLLLAQTRNCLVIPALSFQSLSLGFFLLLSLKNTYKILSGAAWFCSYDIFSHNLPSFAATHTLTTVP